jgi:hypothetical protein
MLCSSFSTPSLSVVVALLIPLFHLVSLEHYLLFFLFGFSSPAAESLLRNPQSRGILQIFPSFRICDERTRDDGLDRDDRFGARMDAYMEIIASS